jgi:transposase-like protein
MPLNSEIESIRANFLKIRRNGSRIVFPEKLKSQVIELWEQGVPLEKLCEELQLHKPQIYGWRTHYRKQLNTKQSKNFKIHTIPIVHSDKDTRAPLEFKKNSCKFLLRIFSFKISWS